jgi:hypothetical protein
MIFGVGDITGRRNTRDCGSTSQEITSTRIHLGVPSHA